MGSRTLVIRTLTLALAKLILVTRNRYCDHGDRLTDPGNGHIDPGDTYTVPGDRFLTPGDDYTDSIWLWVYRPL